MSDVNDWVDGFVAATNGYSLSDEERETILELAGIAAHASERTAAPLTCWLAGAAGLSPASALEIARALAGELQPSDPETGT